MTRQQFLQRKQEHLPCPRCTSSDAYTINTSGWGWCYSCSTKVPPEENGFSNMEQTNTTDTTTDIVTYDFLNYRGISHQTMERYNVFTKLRNGVPDVIGFEYPSFVKLRTVTGKTFSIKHKDDVTERKVELFGQRLFDPASKPSITIVEGEVDALSVYEMTNGSTAAVSLSNGASGAFKDLSQNYDYINSFDRIIFCFDNDSAGKAALERVVTMFDYNKTFIVNLTSFKDANDYLTNNRVDDFISCWKHCKKFAPTHIVHTFKDISSLLDEAGDEVLLDYPFENVQHSLRGIARSDLVLVKGDTGIGKTEFLRAIEYHALRNTDLKIGVLHMEEKLADTVKAMATYHLQKPVSVLLEDGALSKKDVETAYQEVVKDENRYFIHKSFDVDDEQMIYDNIRFMAKVSGCSIVFVDHLSWLATGTDQAEDERRKLDRISQKLKLLTIELNIAIFVISHVNDDGKTRGSRNIVKAANTVIHLHRDVLNENIVDRNKLFISIEKGRRQGSRTGPCGFLFFDPETFILRDYNEASDVLLFSAA